jgi:hypothetical protein
MSSVVIAGDTSGTVTLAAPAVSGTTTLTLPATTDTLVGKTTTDTLTNKTLTSPTITGATITVASTAAPAFSAYSTTLTSTSNSTWTKVTFNTEEFDTNSNFASNRFTPTVAGYYQVNTSVSGPSSAAGIILVNFYKNGSNFKSGNEIPNSLTGTYVVAAALIYCNGSTDYIEVYAIQTTGGTANLGSNSVDFAFSASMVRSA